MTAKLISIEQAKVLLNQARRNLSAMETMAKDNLYMPLSEVISLKLNYTKQLKEEKRLLRYIERESIR